ncbi:hypothetical protein RF11_12446 [Thelohanellus kitauei]|uniref:Uncharacterized protein n=1 Tax=Thelohanellus kitauei TaxID=669202 RepID=A0A0C2NCS7_THEKT|nr:hypothetical protein RF11_12446 [Thelohanellus kitauei]
MLFCHRLEVYKCAPVHSCTDFTSTANAPGYFRFVKYRSEAIRTHNERLTKTYNLEMDTRNSGFKQQYQPNILGRGRQFIEGRISAILILLSKNGGDKTLPNVAIFDESSRK